MKFLFTQKEYADAAVQANKTREGVFILVQEKEIEVPKKVYPTISLEYDAVKKDEQGNALLDESGNEIMEHVITETEDKTKEPIIKMEKVTTKVAELKIAPSNYYVCYRANYTDGTKNKNYKKQNEQLEKEAINNLQLERVELQRALYNATGKDFNDILEMLKEQKPEVDNKAIAIELQANMFTRGTNLKDGSNVMDTIGALFKYTPKDIDNLFLNKTL